ncbi:MAG TPA: tRNA (adenosine(37)-N6)-threonylcarbamoyltransferase complex transferase subunit TsaD [Acidimicrobiales bacterium]|nr:tRNA (adenosine(37)-N6)-threonylcarbamoyltransferase complex transferase subunit TsaD [Acidimicrobiales bacterium]
MGDRARLVLGVETSCDETAAAVVAGGLELRSSVVSSQVDLHARFGGVVPEIAGRAHLERIVPVVAAALADAGCGPDGRGGEPIEAVAATIGPGLTSALVVGVSAAKALALAWGVPFVGVNHLEGHLYAALLDDPGLVFPAVVLLVSGGHTLLVAMDGPGRYRLLGRTLDDAAGEAFDKVARFLGLGYPGGPAIQAAAAGGDPGAVALPRPLLGQGLDCSFSGLKTAVVRYVREHPGVASADVAAAFQAAVVDVLVDKALAGALAVSARSICLAGGVAANGPLRAAVAAAAAERDLHLFLPSPAMCTDNAAMIAAAGHFRLERDGPTPLDAGAEPNLPLAPVPA